MAVFKVETKNKVDIDKKPRVYFTCHPDDFEKHFKKICDDIFKTHDCAIYYTEDMTAIIADDDKQVDLGRNNLFVIPVTFKLLTTPNRAMDEDIPYALKEHIPVLPIMMEPGIDEFYSKPDKFGELQYLNPYSTDLTEISYEEKLKKYLESVLISDELAKRVRAAFDAYIFLSYRKKDRKYANELMRLIHSNPECRDIAIWFDEFLTPGESFKENIEKVLDDCKLFTLLVTPQLLEKVVDENGEERDNYVISTELPLARKKKEEKGTDIFAVEMEKTDKKALSAINIQDYVNSSDSEFRTRLIDAISRMAITTNNTPEHNFLIGLAYLDGIDVELDYEYARELISTASENGVIEATKKLVSLYQNGIGVSTDAKQAIVFQMRLAEQLEKAYEVDQNETIFYSWLDSVVTCGEMFNDIGMNEEAKAQYLKVSNKLEEVHANFNATDMKYAKYMWCRGLADTLVALGRLEPAIDRYMECTSILLLLCLSENGGNYKFELISTYNLLALTYSKLGQYNHAIEEYLHALALSESKENIAATIVGMAQVYERRGDCNNAYNQYQKAKEIYQELWEDTKDNFYRCNLAMVCSSMGDICDMLGQSDQALQLYLESIGIKKEVVDDTGLYKEKVSLATTYNNLSMFFATRGDYMQALILAQKAMEIRETLVEESDGNGIKKDLSDSYNNMANIMISKGNVATGVELFIKAINILEELVGTTQDRQNKIDLCCTYDNLGNVYRILKRFDEAMKCFDRSLQIIGSLSSEEEDRAVLYQRAFSQMNIGTLKGDLVHLEAAYEGFSYLAEKYPKISDYAKRRDVAKRRLGELQPLQTPAKDKLSLLKRMKNIFKKP
ncbi:MAG: tetratricopeptide repeat protein [Clostridia bacterium]|nr:tetratricopeptide repeat protein [Clostridia bacterium]